MKKNTGKNGGGEEDRESISSSGGYYYPGCRKDANCSCKICLASINATLDLMPFTAQKSSLTRLSEVTPISFGSLSLSTPTSRARSSSPHPEISPPPPPLPSATSSVGPGRRAGFPVLFVAVAVAVAVGLSAEFGGAFPGAPRPVFSGGSVRSVGERAWGVKGLDGKLRFLESSFGGLLVSNCSFADSKWEITQDGLLLNSHCKLYKSLTEEIRIWGWPLQTAGLLVTGFSSRSFTVISGRVTEWCDGKIGYVTRKANSSWTHPKWGSSAVQLDPNTWILEYRRSPIIENPRLVSEAVAFLKHRVSRILGKVAQDFWLFFSLDKTQCCSFGTKGNVQVPT